MFKMQEIVGTYDILLITLDTLRYDVAQDMWREGRTPFLASLLPPRGWEARHTPGSFTYAAHHAFFAGFLPTPAEPGVHPRLFATRTVIVQITKNARDTSASAAQSLS